jgi:hypothetical protein
MDSRPDRSILPVVTATMPLPAYIFGNDLANIASLKVIDPNRLIQLAEFTLKAVARTGKCPP